MADGWPVIKEGDKDSEESNGVIKVQLLLRQRGAKDLIADHIFGPKTAAAVKAFQKDKGLTVDGIVGDKTWPALIVTVKLGAQGDAVRAVQSQWRFIDHDGIFGQGLDALVRQFQKDSKLTVDGIVGPNTWKAMGKGPIIDPPAKKP